VSNYPSDFDNIKIVRNDVIVTNGICFYNDVIKKI